MAVETETKVSITGKYHTIQIDADICPYPDKLNGWTKVYNNRGKKTSMYIDLNRAKDLKELLEEYIEYREKGQNQRLENIKVVCCRFCKSDDVEVIKNDNYRVRCNECGATGPISPDILDAINKWNRG